MAPTATIEVTLVLRPAPLAEDHALRRKVRANDRSLPGARQPLTREELLSLQAPLEAELRRVAEFAERHGLRVAGAGGLRTDVRLVGTAGSISRAFQVDLRHFEHPGGVHRAHTEPIHLPAELHGAVEGVVGLDQVPMIRRRATAVRPPHAGRFRIEEIARYYRFPTRVTGRGQRIAILSFGGGFHASDLTSVQGRRPAAGRPRRIPVLGSSNRPVPYSALRAGVAALDSGKGLEQVAAEHPPEFMSRFVGTLETTMDAEIAMAVAPEAEVLVYFAPNEVRGYYHAILAALGLEPAGSRRPAVNVIAISWGASEAEWTPHAMRVINSALRRARDLGVTVCCASGDLGSTGTDGRTRLARVNFPSSSPYALACGGTTMRASGGRITGESAWNSVAMGVHGATGGGVSGVFERPWWQDQASVPSPADPRGGIWVAAGRRSRDFRGRGVPDVAADADPLTGYSIVVGGHDMAGGGTSAVAPLWAGLLALLSDQLGRPVGWVTPLLYRPEFRRAFRPIRRGTNNLATGARRFFRARDGWNACTGLGSPLGDRLLAALSGSRQLD